MDLRVVALSVAAAIVVAAVREFTRGQVRRGRAPYAWIAFGASIPIYGSIAAFVGMTFLYVTTSGLVVGLAAFACLILVVNVRAVTRARAVVHQGGTMAEQGEPAGVIEPSGLRNGVILVGGLTLAAGILLYALALTMTE